MGTQWLRGSEESCFEHKEVAMSTSYGRKDNFYNFQGDIGSVRHTGCVAYGCCTLNEVRVGFSNRDDSVVMDAR